MTDEPEATAPLGSINLPVRSIHVEVIEGPDLGLSKGMVDTLTIGGASGNDLILTDPSVSRYHLEVTRGDKGFHITDCGSTNGTLVGGALVMQGTVPANAVLRLGRTALRVSDGERSTRELHGPSQLGDLYGRSLGMRHLMATIERAARSRGSVLLVGESGTGKEVIARAIHTLSKLEGPLVTVDCGAMSANLVASELFGHERGAFTGADRQHIGAFERAHGGTLFLDEIGELPAELQANLLGAVERRRFRRVGGRQEVAVDIRIVSATNRDLRSEVNANKFRLDLYYRLSVVTVKVPPLRDRADDIPLLVEHFLRECGCTDPVSTYFTPQKMQELQAHFWSGNVRELRNVVEATVALGESPPLIADTSMSAPTTAAPGAVAPQLDVPYKDARGAVLQAFESAYLKHLIERCNHNVSLAAREARMDRSHLITLLARHGLH